MRIKRQKRTDESTSGLELPDKFDPVTLIATAGERFPARVAEREVDSLLVTSMVALGPLHDHQLDGLVLEFERDQGRIRLRGSVTVEQDELLRFRELHAIEILQRREHVRAQARCPVLVSFGPGRAQSESHSIDVSGSGILLDGPQTLQVGDRVYLQITIASSDEPVSATGTVVRSHSRGHRAVTFDSISEGDQRRLIHVVFERQRIDRSRGLKLEDRDRR